MGAAPRRAARGLGTATNNIITQRLIILAMGLFDSVNFHSYQLGASVFYRGEGETPLFFFVAYLPESWLLILTTTKYAVLTLDTKNLLACQMSVLLYFIGYDK